MVYMNDASAFTSPMSTSVAGFKYRVSNTNFDMSLDRGGGTSSGNFMSAGLGNTNQLSGREFDILITNTPGEGFTFTMTSTHGTSGLYWGSNAFAGSTSAATIAGTSPGASFNTLAIDARASLSGSVLDCSNLFFSSATLSLGGGLLVPGFVWPSTREPYDAANGTWSQRVSADTDLSQHAWTLAARVTATRPAGSGSDETLKFTVSAGMGLHVPTTASSATLAIAACGVMIRRERRA